MNNEFVTLSDEQLEMVAGGVIGQTATASASSSQVASSSLVGSTTSAGLALTATQAVGPNTAAAASTADAGNIVQSATNSAIAVNGVRSRQFNTFTF